MANLTSAEQLFIELVNRGRLDPAGEAARLHIALNEGLAAGTISTASKQPLAPNGSLHTAARGHSQYMIDTDTFGHEGIGDGTPGSRIEGAGYTGWTTYGENIAYTGTFAVDFTADTITNYQNLFIDAGIAGRGHRTNLLRRVLP